MGGDQMKRFLVFAADSGNGGQVDGRSCWEFDVEDGEVVQFLQDKQNDPKWGRIEEVVNIKLDKPAKFVTLDFEIDPG
jgi:hypothetical protein